ncbi:fibronectin type III domain-containing protein [Paenibacillus dendritiformis]|uniref:fibronectin type III domain-containing protein n=1 Tax=Paenibacillus dendritiformis TaxID=130049 RepID=UPI00387E0A98
MKELRRTGNRMLCLLMAFMLAVIHVPGSAAAEGDQQQLLAEQEAIAQWVFKDAGDNGIFPAASGAYKNAALFENVGGTYEYYSDNAITYQGWDRGVGTKYWLATVPTTGFKNITVSSTQTSSGTGPRDFKAQFSLDNRTWTDIQGGVLKMETHNFNCKNNACKLINKPLPKEANNQPLLYVRWVVNSDARTSGESGGVGSAGSSRIKDVRIAGERIDGSGHTPRLVNMTFNGDPKTSIALAWYTDQMTGTVLQVVEASKMQGSEFPVQEALVFNGSAEAIKTFMSAKDREKKKYTTFISHRASADNLKPGTAYKYRVGNGDDAGWSRIGSFTTDAAGNQPYHFIVGSDSQASKLSAFEKWQDTFRKAIDQIGDPKFLINVGDLVDNGDLEEQWQWMLGVAQEELAQVPFVPVLGGHEVQDYDGDETTPNRNFYNHFNVPLSAGVNGAHEGSIYSFEYGDALFLVINSQFEGELKSNGKDVDWADDEFWAQLDWMRLQVAKTDKKWKFVSLHKGPYSAGDNAGQWEDGRIQFYKKYLVPVFDEMGIDIVFEAHDHMYMRSYQMLNDVPVKNVPKDGQGRVLNPPGSIYLMPNSLGEKFYTKYPGYNDYFAAINEQPFKKMFVDVSIADDVLKLTAYTADKAKPAVYDEYAIKRTDGKPDKVEQAKLTFSGKRADLSWKMPSSSSEPVRGFRIYEKNGQAGTNWSAYIPAAAGQSQYTYSVNNLDSSRSYEFIIKAVGTRNNSDPVSVKR